MNLDQHDILAYGACHQVFQDPKKKRKKLNSASSRFKKITLIAHKSVVTTGGIPQLGMTADSINK